VPTSIQECADTSPIWHTPWCRRTPREQESHR
jgi:hypothetical protein